MTFRTVGVRLTILAGCALVLAGCASDRVAAPVAPSLTITGSAGAPPGASGSLGVSARVYSSVNTPLASAQTGTVVGDPASVAIGMYALYLSTNGDCSAPVLVVDNGSTPVTKDFVANPVLFTGSPAAGTYRCVILRISDAIHFTSASAGGPCLLKTDYAMDIYRAPDTDWVDVAGASITATGTDSVPSDDRVFIFATTDTAAALARGISPHQLIALTGALTVPGNATFFWNAKNTVGYGSDNRCGMNPPALSFR